MTTKFEEGVAHARKMRERPTFEELFSDFARSLSRRSTCRRLQVGCVIASLDHRHVFGIGYNGGAAGGKNDCDGDEPGKCGCVHAEANAVINCTVSREVVKLVYVTDLPCVMCAKFLVNLGGVHSVTYGRDYRLRDGVAVLANAGVMVAGPMSGDAPR